MGRLALAALGVLAGGCITSSTVVCADGTVCPGDTVCLAVAGDPTCATPAQVAACVGLADLTVCAADSVCHGGVDGVSGACLPVGCGNRRRDPIEVCDDGNNVPGDGCAADCGSDETCGNGVVDLVTGEQCDDGPDGRTLSHDGCASDCTREAIGWTTIERLSEATDQAIAYDAHRDRMVAVMDVVGFRTWESDGDHWTPQTPPVSPASRFAPAIAYDANRRRVVLFGGSTFDDTWEWDGATWMLRSPAISPPPRQGHAMVYDPVGRRVILFGGLDTAGSPPVARGDTWTWDGVAWTPLAGPSPGPRTGAAMAFDPRRGAAVLFGGWNGFELDTVSSETWELSGSTWTLRDTAPALARREHALGYDPRSGRVLLHGGRGRSDTWAWTGTGWTELPGGNGPPAYGHSMVTMTRAGVLLLVIRGEVYRWDGGSWTRDRAPAYPAPIDRAEHAAAVDLAGRRLVIHGGRDDTRASGQTFVWSGVWREHAGPTPGELEGAAMVYDERREEFVLFGGNRRLPAGGAVATNETWVFDGVTWSRRMVTVAPPARIAQTMVYDPAREQVVLFGGFGTAALDDTWIWDGETWSPRAPTTTPPPRSGAAAAYDPLRRVVVMFGGEALPALFRDTWTWDGTTWTLVADSGPPGRARSAAAWDPARRRVILYGGAPFGLDYGDQWEWDGLGWTQIPVTVSLPPRSGHVMVSAIDGAGVLVFGGSVNSVTRSDLAWLRWDGPAGDETCRGVDLDGDGATGCARAPGTAVDLDCWQVCRPRCPPGSTDAGWCDVSALGCGDRVCDAVRESCVTCEDDCGRCPSTCGDLVCDPGAAETATTCPGDCP